MQVCYIVLFATVGVGWWLCGVGDCLINPVIGHFKRFEWAFGALDG